MQLWRSDYGPFIRYAQYSYCRRLIVVPLTTFHRLAELIGDPKGELIFLFNTARCGSTLLTQVHRTGSNLNSLLRQPASPRPAIDCFCLTGAKAGRVHCPRGVGCIPCLTCLISLLDPILHIIHSFLGSWECSPNGSSVQASCRIHRERQRPRQSVCGNNPYLTLRAVPAMPANNQHYLKLLRTLCVSLNTVFIPGIFWVGVGTSPLKITYNSPKRLPNCVQSLMINFFQVSYKRLVTYTLGAFSHYRLVT